MPADAAAREKAQNLRVELGLRSRRHAALRALRVVHEVFGAVEVAALGLDARASQALLWDGQFVLLLGRGTVSPRRGTPQCVLHDLCLRAGPWREGYEPRWVFACVRYGACRAGRAQLCAPCPPHSAPSGQRSTSRATFRSGALPVGSAGAVGVRWQPAGPGCPAPFGAGLWWPVRWR